MLVERASSRAAADMRFGIRISAARFRSVGRPLKSIEVWRVARTDAHRPPAEGNF
jgi:hypothetical protein